MRASRRAVLHKPLNGIRKASALWQRFLRDVLADAGWQASVIFASMYTLGSDDLLVVADEVDLDAVEAHLTKRLEVKVLARIGGKRSPSTTPMTTLTHCTCTSTDAWRTCTETARIFVPQLMMIHAHFMAQVLSAFTLHPWSSTWRTTLDSFLRSLLLPLLPVCPRLPFPPRAVP